MSKPYRAADLDGRNGTLNTPIAPDGVPRHDRTYEIPAREGRAVRLRRGEGLTIVNPSGTQVCDFWAMAEESSAEFLSMEHCRTALGRVTVAKGDVLVTNRRRPILEIVEDTSPGVHDTLIACCDGPRYEQLGAQGYHDNCADNFRMSLQAIGVHIAHVPSPFNIWMNVALDAEGAFEWSPPVAEPASRFSLCAHMDCIAVMSACPQDMTAVNGATPGPLRFELSSKR